MFYLLKYAVNIYNNNNNNNSNNNNNNNNNANNRASEASPYNVISGIQCSNWLIYL